MKYNTILFDLDETLFDFRKTEKNALNKLFSNIKSNYSKEEMINTYKEINKKIWIELEEGKITPDELHSERFNRVIQKLNLNEDKENLATIYTNYLAEGAFVFEETKEIIDYLKDKYTLAIITNGLTFVQKSRLKKSGYDKLFKEVIISQEVNYSKPNPKIFEIAFEKLELNHKSKVLMIGDNLKSDIYGANNFGIDSCYCNFNNLENNSDVKPTYEINSLLELKNIL